MIGVAVPDSERSIASEFFELCKTPWEFYRQERSYPVVLSTLPASAATGSRLTLQYGREFQPQNPAIEGRSARGIRHRDLQAAVFGRLETFGESAPRLAWDIASGRSILTAKREGDRISIELGYNLFAEVQFLLSEGQPVEEAHRPSLEVHIALLRDLITRSGIPFDEIPPIPTGYPFLICLTHDLDHPVLRNHGFDHTIAGFLLRAVVGSAVDLIKGRRGPSFLVRNWLAAATLPLVKLGWAPDFWSHFDRYLGIEAGLGATYFVIPRKNDPGRPPPSGVKSAMASNFGLRNRTFGMRACRYAISDIAPQLRRIAESGQEVALHGIDAWLDAASAQDEGRAIAAVQVREPAEIGVRMHWLYLAQHSFAELDRAGFTYDSTVGFTATIGYRGGTSQVYRPAGATRLLELPLHVMDTALFYPSYLHLTESEAHRRVAELFAQASDLGGVITINWHDRSIAPDRQWDGFYLRLLQEGKSRGAWFPTAAQAVAWFRGRRDATFETSPEDADRPKVHFSPAPASSGLPGYRLRRHRALPPPPSQILASGPAASFVDFPVEGAAVPA